MDSRLELSHAHPEITSSVITLHEAVINNDIFAAIEMIYGLTKKQLYKIQIDDCLPQPKINLNIQNQKKESALHLAVMHDVQIHFTTLLLLAGINYHLRNQDGKTALELTHHYKKTTLETIILAEYNEHSHSTTLEETHIQHCKKDVALKHLFITIQKEELYRAKEENKRQRRLLYLSTLNQEYHVTQRPKSNPLPTFEEYEKHITQSQDQTSPQPILSGRKKGSPVVFFKSPLHHCINASPPIGSICIPSPTRCFSESDTSSIQDETFQNETLSGECSPPSPLSPTAESIQSIQP